MEFYRFGSIRIQGRHPGPPVRVVVISEDPSFWLSLRRGAVEFDATWVHAPSTREGLVAVEDSRVRLVVLDGALPDRPAPQVLRLIKQIRPQLPILFAYQAPNEEWEREAREAGVLYYGDRTRLDDMARVIRQSLPTSSRSHPKRTALRRESENR